MEGEDSREEGKQGLQGWVLQASGGELLTLLLRLVTEDSLLSQQCVQLQEHVLSLPSEELDSLQHSDHRLPSIP